MRLILQKTPSSAVWLIAKYRRVLGRIAQLESQQQKASAELAELRALQKSLSEVMKQHDFDIDVGSIRPTKPVTKQRLLPHGHALRFALECMRKAGDTFISTDAITQHVLRRGGLPLTAENVEAMHRTVRENLKKKAQEGLVERCHVPPGDGGFGLGYWRLSR